MGSTAAFGCSALQCSAVHISCIEMFLAVGCHHASMGPCRVCLHRSCYLTKAAVLIAYDCESQGDVDASAPKEELLFNVKQHFKTQVRAYQAFLGIFQRYAAVCPLANTPKTSSMTCVWKVVAPVMS